ncbi:hypothetical protein ACFX13_012520 [Malus domestica]
MQGGLIRLSWVSPLKLHKTPQHHKFFELLEIDRQHRHHPSSAPNVIPITKNAIDGQYQVIGVIKLYILYGINRFHRRRREKRDLGKESLPRHRGEEADEQVCEIKPWLVVAELDLSKVEESEDFKVSNPSLTTAITSDLR